jgi:hypothetical protein
VKTAKDVFDELAESHYFLGERKGTLIISAFQLEFQVPALFVV